MKRYIAVLSLFGAVALIQGCATPALTENMVPPAPIAASKPADPSLAQAIQVQSIAGGSETNPMWVSKVSDNDFKAALVRALQSAGLLSADGSSPRFRLDATLLSLEQPMFGLDLKVTCSVRYDLSDASTGKRVFGKTITTPFTATFSDSALAVARLRIANEGAVRQNLAELLDELLKLRPPQ
jgi:hypothetical protein